MQDYVNVVVLNAVNELLVLEGYGHGFEYVGRSSVV